MSSELDPRIMKTKRQLKVALIKLLTSQSTQSLSIQQITETAEITRGTFYLHYRDKQDFIQTIINDFVVDLFQSALIDGKESLEPKIQISEHVAYVFSLEKGFKYMADNYQTFIVLFGLTGKNNFAMKVELAFRKHLQLFLKAVNLTESQQTAHLKLKADFIITGLLGTMKNWLAEGIIYSPHFISRSTYNFIHEKDNETVSISDFFFE
ncbi:TetR/AcrR family transcriptional regulator [Pediococcus ethanolidurans]|uniref:Transcriptional regulator, TetR family n=1 Tax=Pediococcus ethanolidurans TaxID=319653 RepID=A0A0R2K886_9LACO|nr:TetR/AcrR family transcriptional regulator [Pediococcus ethanolidurans]KRN82468.1 hypothetical protein IV87_GL000223 [Pediococcus ethanolidurans]GEN94275.1 TetR family transcriptional regulator [Pediococcus ethanolidurans]SER14112.1 transcriptional regulator, TetR family [Pediococcus ethanolidurans]